MAAPIAGFVQLPTDSGNTGKKIQTQSEVVGADTVHAHYFVQRSERRVVGIHHFNMPLQSVVASAHNGTSTGFAWLQLPAGSAVNFRLRMLEISLTCVTEVDMLTAPRIAISRFTFTGTASGANIAAALRKTGDAAALAVLRTAVTGMTVTVGATAWATIAPTLTLTTSGLTWNATPVAEYKPADEEDYLDIAPGEGLLLWQPDAGTASDGRRFTVSGRWDEYDTA